jgi:hypothetical protein
MRLVPILLLLLNLFVAGYFLLEDRGTSNDPDPAARQIHPESIRIVRADQHAAAATKAKSADDAEETPLACATWGTFTESQVAVAETRLGAFELGTRLSRTEAAAVTSYLVIIPPIERRSDLTLRLEGLRRAGVNDLFVINDGESRNGISLGFFKTEEAANRHLAALKSKGVSDAIVKPRASGSRLVVLSIKDVSPAERTKLEGITGGFPASELKFQPCPTGEGQG